MVGFLLKCRRNLGVFRARFCLPAYRKYVSTWGQLTNAFDGQQTRFSLPKTTGVFGVEELQDSRGFELLTTRALHESHTLVNEAVIISGRIKEGRDSAVRLIEKFDHLSNTLCNVADLAEFVRLSHPDEQFRQEAGNASLAINEFVEKLNTNVELYNILKSTLQTSKTDLDEETQHVAESLVFDFEQSGIHLDDVKRQKFVKLQDNILRLGSQFVTGTTSATLYPKSQWPSHVNHSFHSDDSYIYIDGLNPDSVDPQLRELSYKAYMYPNHVQLSVLDKLLESRNELAELVGFPSFLTRSLNGTMAGTPETVDHFLSSLAKHIQPVAQRDMDLLANFHQANSPDSSNQMTVKPWDTQYLTNLARTQLVSKFPLVFSDYFTVGTCMEGLSLIFNHIYGIILEPCESEPGEVWHPYVIKLAVKQEDEGILGYIYCDLYYRPNKVQQDCHFTIRGGCQLADGSYQLPVVCIVCNFPSPPQYGATKLTHSMIENLYHEMGHAMHSMLGRTKYQHITGTRTATDLVEVPSILMEYFAWEPSVLSKFARHHRSGKPMPEEAIKKLCESRHIFASLEMQLQVFYSMVDQRYHCNYEKGMDTTEILRELQQEYTLIPYIQGTTWQQRFSHLHGGYAGRYYSYLWCRAVASRIWNQWFNADPLSREAGERYRHKLLKYGGGRHPKALVEDMLGQHVDIEDLVTALHGELIWK